MALPSAHLGGTGMSVVSPGTVIGNEGCIEEWGTTVRAEEKMLSSRKSLVDESAVGLSVSGREGWETGK